MKISPEVRVFIQALRSGKSGNEAFREYCLARQVVLIELDGDPMNARPLWDHSMASAMGADAHEEGGSDEEIAEAFTKGLKWERDKGCGYRVKRDGEKPSQADLIRSLDTDNKMRVAEIFGMQAVIVATAGGEVDLKLRESSAPVQP